MNSEFDVIVIGGGAAGMIAAGRAAARKKRVLLIEKNQKLGEKLLISGGDRCNVLNAEEDEHVLLSKYGAAEQFLYSPFSQFGMRDTFSFFESRGLPLKIEAKKRAFPRSDSSKDVARLLQEYMRAGGVEINVNNPVSKIVSFDGQIKRIIAKSGSFSAASYILATGGVSHPETGSTGDGFGWLRALGHGVKAPSPTIVPLKTGDAWAKRLAGISIPDANISFFANDAKRFAVRGTILFTHFGVSGPLILNAAGAVSDLMQEGSVTARIDAHPDSDLGALDRLIVSAFDESKNKDLRNAFSKVAPAGTGDAILSLEPSIDPQKKTHSVTKAERKKLARILKNLPLTIEGLMGLDRAVIADGGVDLREIDTKTMRSLKCGNLFIAGDLLDVSRPSGGYSLQLAWTTGYVAGSHC